MATLPVPPLSKDPEGLSGSQSALQYMTETQLTLRHQGKEMTQGKGVSKFSTSYSKRGKSMCLQASEEGGHVQAQILT